MKVFAYDIESGKRGAFVAEIARPHATGSYVHDGSVKFPYANSKTKWNAIKRAEDRRGNLIKFDMPVCFCTGEEFADMARTDGTWCWYVLLPN